MPNAVLQRLVSEREQMLDTTDQILAHAEEEERDPSASELELVRRNRGRITELEPQITELLELEETRARAASTRGQLIRAGAGRPAAEGAAPEPPAEAGGYLTFAQFARDQILATNQRIAASVEPELRQRASARLERAVTNTITSDVPGLILPQHLAQILDVINKSRPIVEASRQVNLTSGTLTWPRIDQRPLVSKQAAEKTETTSQAMKVSMQNTAADTYLGAGDLSWQTITWSNPDALALWFDLAAEAYAEQTEIAAAADLEAGAAGAGPVTVGSDDLAGWTAAIAAAAGAIRGASRANPDGIALDVQTGYHLLGMVSEASPVFLTVGPGSIGAGTGNIAGLKFIISDALPVGTAIVGDFTKLLCAETAGAPVEMRAVEPAIGGLQVGVIGAFASAVVLAGAFCRLVPPAPEAARAAARKS